MWETGREHSDRKEEKKVGVRLLLTESSMTARLSGEIDHHGAREMREEIDRTAEKMRPKTLRLDFTSVPFMDSSGVGVIVGRYKKLEAMGGELSIIRIKNNVDKILEISGIKKIIQCENGGRTDE